MPHVSGHHFLRRALAVGSVLVAFVGVLTLYPRGTANGSRPKPPPPPAPQVLALRPSTLHGRGNAAILVLGRHFTPGSAVTVGGRRARVLDVRNPDALVVDVPSGIGEEIVRVVTGGGTSASRAGDVLHYATTVLV